MSLNIKKFAENTFKMNAFWFSHFELQTFNPSKMQRYTFYFIWKLLYMFWVVTPPMMGGGTTRNM
jgi:hypothetical protein